MAAMQILYNEPMKNHTSFKVGGPADIFIEPDDSTELVKAIKDLREQGLSYYIIGNGSNLLVSDKGLRGAVIKIGEKFGSVSIDNDIITAESGVLLSTLSKMAAREGLTGMEFASGIPGSLGGAVTMNAGAYGGEMKDIVEWVELLDQDLNLKRLKNDEMKFMYRKSIIEPGKHIVLRCCIRLKKGNKDEIDSKMAELAEKRKSKQPLHLPSAGSTFKRPEGYFAGKLIEDAGLRGFTIGGAQVSTLHCGFVVNNGDAAAKDVYDLIRHVQKTVFEKFNVMLEPEVKILGEF
ncbi:MAG TPA: UDP-N-acetylmuramate dehydrogenase [Bacillota bacterium]|nr:UDP-N-acetylmuramate dehydrogenase [Bacillota bacterium]HQJ36706.1 UDP-N-acetylmuramate dehydrogenase [Bacillota bacterium]HRS20149.1 UDP-N-acetylmuramate dehydrogenase [Clostridia bacterium]